MDTNIETCPECGQVRVRDSNFCVRCGHKYQETARAHEQVVPKKVLERLTCLTCGQAFRAYDNICPNCGSVRVLNSSRKEIIKVSPAVQARARKREQARELTRKLKLEREQKRKRARDELSSPDNYGYILDYTRKYRHSLDEGIEDENISKLLELLNYKEILDDNDFNKNILIEYMSEVWAVITYDEFKFKISHQETNTVDEIIHNYVQVYQNNDRYEYLLKLVNEEYPEINIRNLRSKINEKKKELEILQFERSLKNTQRYDINKIDDMLGSEFEDFLVELFSALGYYVENIQHSYDQGADLIISKFREKTVVQAKRYANVVGNSAVQEVTASIKHYRADKGMVITTSRFTQSAVELAKSNNIELIGREDLIALIKKAF